MDIHLKLVHVGRFRLVTTFDHAIICLWVSVHLGHAAVVHCEVGGGSYLITDDSRSFLNSIGDALGDLFLIGRLGLERLLIHLFENTESVVSVPLPVMGMKAQIAFPMRLLS